MSDTGGTKADFGFEDYSLGIEIESPTRRVYDADVIGLARFTNDIRPLLPPAPDAPDAPLKPSPLHLFSFGLCLLLHASPVPYIPPLFVAFLGFQQIAFDGDASAGDRIRSTATVVGLEERRSTGVVSYRHAILREDGVTLARSEHSILVRKRGDA